MAWPVKSIIVLITLPIFTACAATLYYYHIKDKEWKKYLKSIQKIEIELKIPMSSVAEIIGRGGCNVRELQDKTLTKITFRNIDGDETHKICKIFGTKENVEMAKTIILDTVNPKDIQTHEMWVSESCCGRIIGRCGDTIRAISRSSNARISVDKSKSLYNNKLVVIKGKPQEIIEAKAEIEKIINEVNSQKNSLPRSPRTRAKNRKGNGVVLDKIPQFERLIGTPNDSMIQVYVSSVASPSNFWVQLITPRAVELDHLVDDMTEYYNKEENRKLHILKEVKKGQIIASKFEHDKKWYRVEVFSVEVNEEKPEESQVDVFYLDYGDSAFYRLGDLYELKPDFLHLKFQAIETSLAGIRPIGDNWEESATEAFEDMVYSAQWKAMLAQVVGHKKQNYATRDGLIPCIRLYDPDGPPGVDIGSQLIAKGFAQCEETDEPGENENSAGEWIS